MFKAKAGWRRERFSLPAFAAFPGANFLSFEIPFTQDSPLSHLMSSLFNEIPVPQECIVAALFWRSPGYIPELPGRV